MDHWIYPAGVVDEDYRGDVRVILFNHSDVAFSIQAGDRIAQLICERIYYPQLQEVEVLFIVLFFITFRMEGTLLKRS